MISRFSRAALLALLATFALMPTASLAQTLYGTIVGTVIDPTGAAVPNTGVTATNKATGQVRTATTSEAGNYTFAAVQPGTYEVKYSKAGFRPVAEPAVEVTANNTSRSDVSLQVGNVSDSITIEAAGATLQTDSATVRSELQGKTLVNLPVPVGRNYQNILVTIPGFSPPQNAHSLDDKPSGHVS